MLPVLNFLLGFTLVASENIALGKPTVQGSTFETMPSDLAVDGNYGVDVHSGDCAHATSPSWWTLDLQHVYLLHRIVIYNRDADQERLDDLTVEGFLTEPQFSPMASLCAYHPGPSGDIVTLTCRNYTLGRYVRLSGKEYMTLCEVEVHGEKVMTSQGCNPVDVPFISGMTSTPATQLGVAESRVLCLTQCHRHPTCNVAGYNHVTKMCTWHATPILPVADSETSLFYVP